MSRKKLILIGVLLETPSYDRYPLSSHERSIDVHWRPQAFNLGHPHFHQHPPPDFLKKLPNFHWKPLNFHWILLDHTGCPKKD